MAADSYLTLAQPCEGEFKDRGSRFIGYAAAAWTEAECLDFIEKIRKAHPKARHHCFAWRLGLDDNRHRANDDGEPSGTAGRPILAQLDARGLRNVAAVVVRYFGGTLLGASGLINAYREATAEALRNAAIEEKIIRDVWRFHFDYEKMPDVMGALKRLGLEIAGEAFGERGQIDALIRQSEVEASLLRIRAAVAKKSLEETASLETIAGLELERLGER